MDQTKGVSSDVHRVNSGSMRSVSVARRYEFRVLKWEGISNLREVHAKPTPMIEKENQGVSSDLLQKCPSTWRFPRVERRI